MLEYDPECDSKEFKYSGFHLVQCEMGEYKSFPKNGWMSCRSGNGACVLSGVSDAAATPAPDSVEAGCVHEAPCCCGVNC